MKAKLIELCVTVVTVFLLFGCLFPLPIDVAGNVLLGWAFYLYRLVPGVGIDGARLLAAAVALALVATGLHAFLRWLVRATWREGDGGVARWRGSWTLGLLGIAALAFAAGLGVVGVTREATGLIGSREPWVRRDTADAHVRIASSNNLKQMGLAFHDHEKALHRFPAGGTFDATGRALHGWQTTILPYIGQDELYRTIDPQRPWNDPANAAALGTAVKSYLYPQTEPKMAGGFALSHYAANARVLGGDRVVTLKELGGGRGSSNTILMGEAAGNFKPWGHPANWRDPARGLNRSPDGFGNPAGKKVTCVAMADGSVRTFDGDTDPEFLELLADPAPAGAKPHRGYGKGSSR